MAKRKKIKKTVWQKTRRITGWFFMGLFFILALFLLASRFSPGGLKALDVKTGSMNPTIRTGSLIFSWPVSSYKVNDIIVFHWSNTKELVTHRIVGVNPNNKNYFQTKGDANKTPDMGLISSDQIVGKVLLTLPFLGYAISFVQSGIGLIIFIAIPSFLIICAEILNIKNELKKVKRVRLPKKARVRAS
jgi:signal peptidase